MNFLTNQKYLIIGKINGDINIYDSEKLILINTESIHKNTIVDIAYTDKMYVTACINGMICIWDTNTFKLKYKI